MMENALNNVLTYKFQNEKVAIVIMPVFTVRKFLLKLTDSWYEIMFRNLKLLNRIKLIHSRL